MRSEDAIGTDKVKSQASEQSEVPKGRKLRKNGRCGKSEDRKSRRIVRLRSGTIPIFRKGAIAVEVAAISVASPKSAPRPSDCEGPKSVRRKTLGHRVRNIISRRDLL
jgi:hypothetical protein